MSLHPNSHPAQGATAPWAVCVLAPAGRGRWAATTRAADRGEAGRVGLPGGKIDAGESVFAALLRESAEEGWVIAGPVRLFYQAAVDGRPVVWALAHGARALADWKERRRGISPVALPLEAIAASGYGNGGAVRALADLLRRHGSSPERWAAEWAAGEEL